MNRHALSQENISYDDEIDFKELFSVLRKSKILIIVITSFFSLSSVLYALSLTNLYKSEAILSVAEESTNALVALYLEWVAWHQWQELLCRQVVKIKVQSL